ncbi:hypothetical protein CKJ90_32805, partial [Klebsiella pneumoniae]
FWSRQPLIVGLFVLTLLIVLWARALLRLSGALTRSSYFWSRQPLIVGLFVLTLLIVLWARALLRLSGAL